MRRASELEIFFAEVARTPLLSADEERAIARRNAAGDPFARNALVVANLRFVVRRALRFAHRGVDLPDLIQEGAVGLLHATRDFDPESGLRFVTYATHWVDHYLREALARQRRTVRVPYYLHRLARICEETEAELLTRDDARPPDAEVTRRALSAAKRMQGYQFLTERLLVAAWRSLRMRPVPLTEGAGGTTSPTWELAADAEERAAMLRALDSLDERERTILRLRHGIGDDGPLTLREIGERLGYTRERVRQLQDGAIKKLRTLVGA